MIVTTLPVRRRSRAERRVLALLRGSKGGLEPDELRGRFHRLRALAVRSGLEVLPPTTAYVGEGELMLLCWIAEAQRAARPLSMPENRCLAQIVRRCAEGLDAVPVRLPPLTMYLTSLRKAAQPRA